MDSTFINCTINENKGKIYNEQGTLFLCNCTLDYKTVIHNYQSANCEIKSCIGGNNTKFEEAEGLAEWKECLIIGGIGIAVAAISFAVGYGCMKAGMAFNNAIAGAIIGCISGALIGAAGGYIADAILAHYTHDHSARYMLMGSMALIGALAALGGAAFAYYTPPANLIMKKTPTEDGITFYHTGDYTFTQNSKTRSVYIKCGDDTVIIVNLSKLHPKTLVN